MTARLAVDALAWAVGGRYVLLDVHLHLAAGEVVALTGANGAGKTTLLELLAGDRPWQQGHVRLDGQALGTPSWAATRLAHLGHRPGLYLDLTAVENHQLFRYLHGQTIDDSTALADLQAVGLAADDCRRPVRTWSRGMLQRAALARVRASDAGVWLLDEPSTGLDAEGVAMLRRLLDEARTRGVAVLLASHDAAVLDACDRGVHLRNGRLEAA